MQKTILPANIIDDLGFESILIAITRQLNYFKKLTMNEQIKFGKRTITRLHLVKSLEAFRKLTVNAINCFQVSLAEICYEKFNQDLNEQFEAYRPQPKKSERGFRENKTFFTAYYSPDLEGSFTQTEEFPNPIYAFPKKPLPSNLTSDRINFEGALKGQGLELFYVSDSLFDIWLLQVEGGGRVKLRSEDGSYSSFYLSYAGTNKKSFKMLSKYMLAKGMLRKGNQSVEAQRKYFLAHPEKQREILAFCPSYVFFKITDHEPLGVGNISLTPGRSMATDYRIYKEYGLISLVNAKRPVIIGQKIVKKKFSRFFISQDTGGAIKGNARADLYFGYGELGELAANHIHTLGDQYFLILK